MVREAHFSVCEVGFLSCPNMSLEAWRIPENTWCSVHFEDWRDWLSNSHRKKKQQQRQKQHSRWTHQQEWELSEPETKTLSFSHILFSGWYLKTLPQVRLSLPASIRGVETDSRRLALKPINLDSSPLRLFPGHSKLSQTDKTSHQTLCKGLPVEGWW